MTLTNALAPGYLEKTVSSISFLRFSVRSSRQEQEAWAGLHQTQAFALSGEGQKAFEPFQERFTPPI